MKKGFNATARKRPVNLTLNEDLLSQAKSMTDNLSAVVESLLSEFVDTIPFVVVVQSAQFDNYRRRVVVPLVRAAAIGKVNYAAFNPTFKIRGTSVVLHPLEIVIAH